MNTHLYLLIDSEQKVVNINNILEPIEFSKRFTPSGSLTIPAGETYIITSICPKLAELYCTTERSTSELYSLIRKIMNSVLRQTDKQLHSFMVEGRLVIGITNQSTNNIAEEISAILRLPAFCFYFCATTPIDITIKECFQKIA